MFSIELFQSNLKTNILGKKNFYYSSTKSTNSDIWSLFKKEKGEGFVVIANEQLQGKGRGDKQWYSKKNKSIICSFLIKQKFSKEKLGLHSILMPIGIILGIKKMTNEHLSIKWPNDILFDNKKLCGIRIETKTINNTVYLNVGFGINVNEDYSDFPSQIKNNATSLKIVSHNDIQREILLAQILNSIDDLLSNKNENDILNSWMKLCCHINKELCVRYNNNFINAKFKKINQNGQAIIHYNNKDIIFDGAILNT